MTRHSSATMHAESHVEDRHTGQDVNGWIVDGRAGYASSVCGSPSS